MPRLLQHFRVLYYKDMDGSGDPIPCTVGSGNALIDEDGHTPIVKIVFNDQATEIGPGTELFVQSTGETSNL